MVYAGCSLATHSSTSFMKPSVTECVSPYFTAPRVWTHLATSQPRYNSFDYFCGAS